MMTGAGVILGTAAYMAPEQAKGCPADKRSDIWSFGCVLFEMLTGRRVFAGEDVGDMLAAVLRAEPDWTALPRDLPASIRALLEGCLTKDRRQRIADISAALFVISHQATLATASGAPAVAPLAPRAALWRRALPYAAAAIAAAAAGYGAWMLKPAPAAPVTRFSITLPEGQPFTQPNRHLVAMSPDGSRLVYVASERLYLRSLDQLDAAPIVGTEGTGIASPRSPFFSPDGQWIGFWAAGQLKKVSVSGGAPVALCAAQIPFGASWGVDDAIVYGQGGQGIWRVSSNGGAPKNIIKVEAGEQAHGPQVLPDGRTVLFTFAKGGGWEQAQIVAHALDTGQRTVLITGGRDARYLPTGHLVYGLGGTLLAVPFDPGSRQVTDGPVSLLEGVGAAAGVTGAMHFSVSPNGALVYVPASGMSGAAARRTLVWVDRQGREAPLAAPARPYVYPRISPDGTRVALDIADENRDIWVWDLGRGTLTRLTFDPTLDRQPVWTPDGRRIIFSFNRAGPPNLFWQGADGTGAAERINESLNDQCAMAVSPAGARLVLRSLEPSVDLLVLALTGERRMQPLVATPFIEQNAEISPDGRWLAFEADNSGRSEIYVRPFPDAAIGQWQVSTEGGTESLWSRDGAELFYRAPDGAVMRVPVERGSTWVAGTPTQLLAGRYYAGQEGVVLFRTYDIAPDGRRFLMIKEADEPQQAAAQRIVVVENWLEELKRRVPLP